MAGQGRPRASCQPFSPARFAQWSGWRFAVTIWLVGASVAGASVAGASVAGAAEETAVRVRIAWGGGAERVWQGRIGLSEGVLSEPVPLGIEADEAGSMWLATEPFPSPSSRSEKSKPPSQGSSPHMVVEQRSPRTYDGVDLRLDAPRDASLLVQLAGADDAKRPEPLEIPLADLLRSGYSGPLDQRGNRLVVHRSPGDELRVTLPRRSLVFGPGEDFGCEVRLQVFSLEPGSKVRVKVQLLAARVAHELWSEERQATAGDMVPLSLEIPLHKFGEGVYDVNVSVSHASRLNWPQQVRPQLNLRPILAERSVQVIVLDKEPAKPAGDGRLGTVVEIDPANPTWWARFAKTPQLQRLPRLWKGPLGSGAWREAKHPLGQLAELLPSDKPNDLSWEAYTLPIHRPGAPHVLEVDYPGDVPQTLGISVVEPNAAGAVVPIGLDSGFDNSPEIGGEAPKAYWQRHRLIFWPRTKAPVVLVTNLRERSPAVYGKIRVLAGWERLPRAFSGGRPERLLAAYLDRPLFPENFCATEAPSPGSDLSVDDWVTFYEGGTRLTEYLHHVGYNGLVLSVMADGSTIYPSSLVEPTPRYDTGTFLSSGQDPVRKDVLEMLLRLFDRDGLQLIPALEFASPLPQLETMLRRGGPDAEGIEPIGPEGIAWARSYAPLRGKAAYYNVLHPRVQDAMLAVVRELADGYARHPACTGLAIQLSAYGYAQLPGPEWGLDDVTIASFQRDTRLQLPGGKGADRYLERMNALSYVAADGQRQWRREWLDWKAAELARFYRRVKAVLDAARPGARLYLTGADMLAGPESGRELRPSLARKTTLAEVLLRIGIEPAYFGEDRSIVLLRPERVIPGRSLAGQATALEVAQLPDVDRCFQRLLLPGAVFYHLPQEARVTSFDEKSPFKPCYTWLAPAPVPAAAQNRRRFVHSLATLDCQVMLDGGWLLSMGQEDALRDLVAAYRQLPAVRFEAAAPASETDWQANARLIGRAAQSPRSIAADAVTVRFATRADRSFAYMVNDTPFRTTARVRVEMPSGCQMEPLINERPVGPLRRDATGAYWEAELEPYDLLGAQFSAPGVKFHGTEATCPQEVQTALERQMGTLGDRIAALRSPPVFGALENADFDQPPGQPGQIPRWTPFGTDGAKVQLDRETKHGGNHSVRLTSNGAACGLASHEFSPPATGRLSISVWLRVADAARQPALRMALIGRFSGRDFFRAAYVGQVPGGEPRPIGTQWGQFIIHVNDLPLEDLTRLHVRFELTGSGDVWIDDVQLCDLAFSKKERVELVRLLSPADAKLDEGQVADCIRLLESYWPRFLAEHVPAVAAPLAQSPAREPAKQDERETGILDRVKSFVPNRLRF